MSFQTLQMSLPLSTETPRPQGTRQPLRPVPSLPTPPKPDMPRAPDAPPARPFPPGWADSSPHSLSQLWPPSSSRGFAFTFWDTGFGLSGCLHFESPQITLKKPKSGTANSFFSTDGKEIFTNPLQQAGLPQWLRVKNPSATQKTNKQEMPVQSPGQEDSME